MALSDMFDKFGRTYRPNDIIFCEYEPGNEFFLIQSGKVRITKVISEREKTLDFLHPGDIFGEMAILEQAPRSATAIADEETKVLVFNRDNFVDLLASQPQLAIKLLQIFAKRIFDAKRRFQILTLPDTESKVADVLIMLAELKGLPHDYPDPVELSSTEDDVASWAGVKADECKKVLNNYVKSGKLSLQPKKMVLKNVIELSRYVKSKRKAQTSRF